MTFQSWHGINPNLNWIGMNLRIAFHNCIATFAGFRDRISNLKRYSTGLFDNHLWTNPYCWGNVILVNASISTIHQQHV